MNLKAFLLSLIIFLSFNSSVFAGGGLVSFESTPSLVRPGEQYTIKPTVYSDQYGGTPCRQCSIAIKFENSQSGDAIVQSDSKTDDNGTMSARVLSQQAGERIIYAEVTMPSGIVYQSSQYVLYYDNKVQPSGSISIKVESQKSLGGNVRQVTLSWNSVSDALDYFVFVRPKTSTSYGTAMVDTRNLSGQITINTSPDYFVKVDACSVYGRCIESSELQISEMKQEAVPTIAAKPAITIATPKPTSNPTVKPSVTTVRIASASPSLEQKIEEPKKERSGFGLRLNQILTWIKSLFSLLK